MQHQGVATAGGGGTGQRLEGKKNMGSREQLVELEELDEFVPCF